MPGQPNNHWPMSARLRWIAVENLRKPAVVSFMNSKEGFRTSTTTATWNPFGPQNGKDSRDQSVDVSKPTGESSEPTGGH